MYRSEKQESKSDALIRRKQDLSLEVNDSRKKHQRQILLKDDQLDKNVKKTLTLCVLTRAQRHKEKSSFSKRTLLDKENESNSTTSLDQEIELSSREDDDLKSDTIIENTISEDESTKDDLESDAIIENTISEDESTKSEESLMTIFKNAFEEDDVLIKLRQAKLNENRKSSHQILKKRFKLFMRDLIIKDNLLYLKDRLVVLAFDSLRLRLLRRFHELLIEEHFEYKAMFHAMSSSYF
jgi:hypothetical protein